MPESVYFDFDLLIERRSTGYRATVLDSPAGEANVDFNSPFTDSELEIFLLRLGGRRILRGSRSRELELAKDFGTRLFDAVFQGEVRGCFRSSLDQIERQRAALRLRLRFADAPELADLPWEYLYYPSRKRFLAISSESPIVRYLDLPEPITPLRVIPPLRILTMISSPIGYPELDVEREFTKLHEAVTELETRSLVVLERLDQPTLSGLQRKLRRGDYHIFHFIGHGAFNPQSDEGVLVLENDQRQPRLVTGGFLGAVLHNKRSLRLAVLNSCEGARGSRSDPYAGTAQNLVQQGIPAVIAMQFEISDHAAIIFAHEFYSALADGFPVDAALTEARLAIFSEGNETEWGTPVLYLRSPDGRIFQVEEIPEAERKRAQRDALVAEADAALAAEEFDVSEEKFTQVLSIDPSDSTARSRLEAVRLQKQVAILYAEGCQHHEEGRLSEARECFLKTQALVGEYKDVGARLTEIAAAQESVVTKTLVSIPAEESTKKPPSFAKWLFEIPSQWRRHPVAVSFAALAVIILVAIVWVPELVVSKSRSSQPSAVESPNAANGTWSPHVESPNAANGTWSPHVESPNAANGTWSSPVESPNARAGSWGDSDLDQLLAQKGPVGSKTKLQLSADQLFEYDSAALKSSRELQKLSTLVKRNPKAAFLVEGYTDSFGTAEYNLDLSERRAESVKRYLVETTGISSSSAQIQTRGYGATKFRASPNGSIEEQSPNRRVEIVVYPPPRSGP